MSHHLRPPLGGPPRPVESDPAVELDRIRTAQLALRRRFMALNGGGFVVTTLLAVIGGRPLAMGVPGGPNLGLALCLLQVALLAVSACLYDRASCRTSDARVDRVRAHTALLVQPERGR
ncbi:hypothetical protein [Streptomyces sp. SID13726]|uniref:hypothetical protein n=1 Tax=Streptomyces sp. SID13726 TaxID=2706058 RepID=UPI0013BA22B5|nr:hypothetical protein [Streptomyces sp. SID13726]NEB03514.1 hypothetical protein [Streptomyces sp. SID13726]